LSELFLGRLKYVVDAIRRAIDNLDVLHAVVRFWGLTFDMSGGPKGAKRPLERPIDGRVRPHAASTHSPGTCQ
jgi:hypothetical protein